MDYQHLVYDFAERTRHNLEVIRQQHVEGNDVFEVTQLINSMLGLLVLPKEHYYQSIPTTPLEQLRKEGWPEPVLSGNLKAHSDLRDLIRLLRNSVAHFNIEFTESGGHIDGVVLSNKRDGKTTWKAALSLTELEDITDRFIDLILSQGDKSQ
jgi:hypothetical protein